MEGAETTGATGRFDGIRRWLKRWFPAIRVVASALMLAFLLHEVKLRSLFPVWDRATFLWLAAGVACTTVALLLSAVRWQRVLSAMEQPSRLGPLVLIAMAGQFVSNFLPSSIGGDALRVTRLSSKSLEDAPETPTAFASVVLDRMSGWLILPLLCLAGLAINPTLLSFGRSSEAALSLSLISLAALAIVLAAAASPRIGGRLAGHAGWLRFMGAVHLGLDRVRRHPLAAAQVIAASILYQLVIVGAGLLAAKALGINIGPTALLAFVPAVAIVQVLPVSIGGLGVREGAFVVFLHPLGVAVGQAVALGLVLYAMHLLSSLLGAPSFAVGQRPRRHAAPPGPAGPLAPAS